MLWIVRHKESTVHSMWYDAKTIFFSGFSNPFLDSPALFFPIFSYCRLGRTGRNMVEIVDESLLRLSEQTELHCLPLPSTINSSRFPFLVSGSQGRFHSGEYRTVDILYGSV